MKLKVSDKHILLRVILTAVFFVTAVVAFTVGVTSIGKKTSGYQLIEAKTDAEALTYNNAVHYKYWFEGSSNQIKRGIRALEAEYTPILAAAYKQLDARGTYAGQVSIGTINGSLGKEVSVSPELYAILQDAYGRTLERNGFNMFAGDLYEQWHSILILTDPEDFDPSTNEGQRERIRALAEEVNDLSNFSLEFLPNNAVRFSVSDGYKAFCSQYEIDSHALDLNVLKDAYMLQWIGEALVEKGYSLGYLFTEEGLVLNTSPRGTLNYDFYTLKDTVYASIELDGVFSGATITAFGMGSDYAYSIGDLYRNEHFNVQTGEFSEVVLTLSLVRPDMEVVDAALQAIQLNNLESEEALDKAASELEKDGIVVSYISQKTLK